RPLDKTTLQTLQNNTLFDWLLIQRAILGSKITPVDQTRLLDPLNLPRNLPAGAPGQAPGLPQPGGMPSGMPGAPGGAPPGGQ
ncbi:MAG TPA: hypothetical protein VFN02_02260, partial [Ktedonobacteraceae bacterium]|nr:hypothetical protein [Ktedonobacteraceae bacterium]